MKRMHRDRRKTERGQWWHIKITLSLWPFSHFPRWIARATSVETGHENAFIFIAKEKTKHVDVLMWRWGRSVLLKCSHSADTYSFGFLFALRMFAFHSTPDLFYIPSHLICEMAVDLHQSHVTFIPLYLSSLSQSNNNKISLFGDMSE